MHNHAHRHPVLFVVLIALATLYTTPGTALGQGTDQILPDPMSSREIDEYATLLDLSPQQRLAVDESHTQYLEAFKTLRDSDIDRFLDQSRVVMAGFMFNPDIEAIKRVKKEYDQIHRRIAALDRQFFDSLLAILTENQMASFERAQRRRERKRESAGLVRAVGRISPAVGTDLSRLADEAAPDPSDRAAIDPALDAYERRLTSAMRKLRDESEKLFVKVAERVAIMLAESDGVDEGRMRNMFGSLEEILIDESSDTMSAAAAIADLNWRSFRSIDELLPPGTAERFIRAYITRAYRDVARGLTPTFDVLDTARSRANLTDAQRDTLDVLRRDARSRHLTVADDMSSAVEEKQRDVQSMRFGGRRRGRNRNGDTPADDALAPYRARQESIQRDITASVFSVMNVTTLDELRALPGPPGEEGAAAAGLEFAVWSPDGGALTLSARPRDARPQKPFHRAGADEFLPPAIHADELTWYSDLLGLTDDDRMILDTMHEDYLGQWNALDTAPITGAQRDQWRWDAEASKMRGPSPADVDRLYDARASMFEQMRRLDDQFLSDAELALVRDDDDREMRVDRARMARTRVVFHRAPSMRGPGRRSTAGGVADQGEAGVDLSLVAHRLGVEVETPSMTLLEYERARTDLLEARYELLVETARKSERQFAEQMSSGTQRWGWPSDDDARSAAARFREQLVTLNQSTLGAMAASLSSSMAASLQSSYRVEAHPQIFSPSRVERMIREGLATLDDLDDTQRERLSTLLAEYRPVRDQLDQQLFELEESGNDDTTANGPERWQRRRMRQQQEERIRFERTDLEEKTMRRLKAILSDSQQGRLGLDR